jgi:hypothetical protein
MKLFVDNRRDLSFCKLLFLLISDQKVEFNDFQPQRSTEDAVYGHTVYVNRNNQKIRKQNPKDFSTSQE